jgi:hypothetical protein
VLLSRSKNTRRNSQPEVASKLIDLLLAACWFSFGLLLDPEDRGTIFHRSIGEFFNGLHDVKFQKIIICITKIFQKLLTYLQITSTYKT